MSAAEKSQRLLVVEIRHEQDVVLARQRGRQIAGALGFVIQQQTRIATALSEIARNAYQYAGGGRVEFSLVTEPHPTDPRRNRQTLVIEVRDKGPGIARLEAILAGQYRSESGLGIGIVGTKRLMDRVEIQSSDHGTTVTLCKTLPPTAVPLNERQIQALADQFAEQPTASPYQEIQAQNQELIQVIEENQDRQDELSRVNQELAETNTGVLALYDELETLHRISLMLASKLDLKALIQAIIDVTTQLTDAEIGAFFLREEKTGRWMHYASSGPAAEVLEGFPPASAPDFFGTNFAELGMEHIPDFPAHTESCSTSQFAQALADKMVVRSCLSVPVIESGETLVGALIFASSKPRVFTERSERILTSIASQAAVGIEKAQLFQTVAAASAAKDDFLAMLSHELRTPLNPVMAIVSSLHGDPRVPADLREDVAVIWRNIRLEARLIDDLLDFNRLIKGKLQLSQEPLDIHPLIASVIDICREELAAKSHRLTTHLEATRTTVHGDAARLQQSLWNVLKNAIKFTPEQGAIEIRTWNVDETLRIEVTDTGRGIEEDAIERIFTAFEQGPSPVASHFGGLGLGLSIARMFVDLHGGKISATSPGLGQGATIRIDLPLVEAASAPEKATPQTQPAIMKGGGRILLVDDHADTLENLARLLRRRGYEVAAAADGAQADAAVRRETFDLFVSDLGLPDISGHQLLSSLRTVQDRPAIALSGYGMESDVASSKAAGFQEHLTKPIDINLLAQTIERLLHPRA